MWSRRALIVGVLCLSAWLVEPASAEAQNIIGDVFRLKEGPCSMRSGTGTPEGSVAGKVCDSFFDTTSGEIYKKITGAAGTTTGWFRLVGPSSATCTTFAGCVAASLETDYLSWTQKLRTDGSYALRSSVTTSGARLEAYSGAGWLPLKLAGGPTRIIGGGFHVGATEIVDPGLGNAQIDGFIGKPGYASQTTGWRIDNAGGADFRYLFSDELHVKVFVADLVRVLNGVEVVAKSAGILGAPFTVPAGGSISTLTLRDWPGAPDATFFESGDYVRVREFSRESGGLSITDAWGIVTSYTDLADGLHSWTFTRLVTNGGAMSTGTVIEADATVIDYGTPGNGFYEVNAIDGAFAINSPYAQIVTWSGDSPIAGNQTLRTRLGNLRGITGVTGEFGLIAGTYAATAGKYFRCGNQACELHGVNLSLWDGATNVIELNRTAPSLAIGSPLPSAYGAGTGIWMGKDGAVYKSRVGIPGGFGWFWDGTKLTWAAANTTLDANGNLTATSATLSGAITATSGAIGAFTINTHLYTGSKTAYNDGLAGVHVGSDGIGLGSTFSVSAAGALVATNATITGAITATSGSFTGSITSTSGTIGGWTLGATSLTAGSGATTVGLDSGGTNPAMYAGSATPGSAPFRVTAAGALTATSATITGTITGSTITGSTMTSSTITAGGGVVVIDSDGIEIEAGGNTNPAKKLKFGGGESIYGHSSGGLIIDGSAVALTMFGGTASLILDNGFFRSGGGTLDLGSSSTPWGNTYLGSARIDDLAGVGAVCADVNGLLVACAQPAINASVTQSEIETLRREVADLRALVASLLNQSAAPARAQR